MHWLPKIISVGTATPPNRFEQRSMPKRFGVTDQRIASLFNSKHIQSRHLYIDEVDGGGVPNENREQLIAKQVSGTLDMGVRAIDLAIEKAGISRKEIDYLCCITTSGFLCPGVSALLIKEMGLREDCSRSDIVGMGCNAALNGLNPVASWARSNPNKNAVMACIEVNSAAYVFDHTLRTAIVNSLFGDGSAAIVVRSGEEASDKSDQLLPKLIDFNSHLIPTAFDAMRFDWDMSHGKWSFFLDRDIPYVVGANAEAPVTRLLSANNLKPRHIKHWLVHSGGKKVIDAIKYNIGLTTHDVRHTVSVLRDYGNISSASVLFSYERLIKEGSIKGGDYGVMMTMGPGSTIETALIQW